LAGHAANPFKRTRTGEAPLVHLLVIQRAGASPLGFATGRIAGVTNGANCLYGMRQRKTRDRQARYYLRCRLVR